MVIIFMMYKYNAITNTSHKNKIYHELIFNDFNVVSKTRVSCLTMSHVIFKKIYILWHLFFNNIRYCMISHKKKKMIVLIALNYLKIYIFRKQFYMFTA